MTSNGVKGTSIADFLKPLHIDTNLALQLSRELHSTFLRLGAESSTQFLPTPISESILRPVKGRDSGCYFAIDIGGTNLRAGFVELLPGDSHTNEDAGPGSAPSSNGIRLHEKSWPIGDHLKNENAESLFDWIGACIASVIRDSAKALGVSGDDEIPMGITFSFPMIQHSLSEATLMHMGKGFAITSNLDLGSHLLNGYERSRDPSLPRIRIVAIANDAVATLISFIYQFDASMNSKAAMGLICGTGSNATIPLKLSSLHPSKRPTSVNVLPGQDGEDVRIAVNTEWSINGSAPPLQKLQLLTKWDRELDAAGEAPGFQPLEYMTAGRYLGELARIVLLDYMTNVLGISVRALPPSMLQRFGLTTTFLSHYRPQKENTLLGQLRKAFPTSDNSTFVWTSEIADLLYQIALAIERRAAGIIAAATIGLLTCAEDIIPPTVAATDAASTTPRTNTNGDVPRQELAVGYTGGCIAHFQNYLKDCQQFLDEMLDAEFAGKPPVRVVLRPCHDGGILGAGILVPAALASQLA